MNNNFIEEELEALEEQVEYDEREMPKEDAELLGGILMDIQNNLDSETTIKNVIKYLMNKNDIQSFDGQGIRFKLENDEVEIIKGE